MLFWAGDFNIRCFFDFTKARMPEGEDLFHPEDLQEMRDKEEVTFYAKEHELLNEEYVDIGLTPLPTYKVQINNKVMKYVTNRRPSWTDRFFYRIKN